MVEDYYSSKQKELKNFKENLGAFWDALVLECQEGPLFDKALFDKCMDYVIALSWYSLLFLFKSFRID
jgi:cohesin complex subunit SA-1/2